MSMPMMPPLPVAFTPRFYSMTGRNLRFTTMQPSMEVMPGWVRLTGPRVPPERWKAANAVMKWIGPSALFVFFISLVLAVATNSTAVGYAGLFIWLTVVVAMSIWWKVFVRKEARPDVAQFPATNVGPISYKFNWNGAAWGIIFGLIGIVIVATIMGRKVLTFTTQVDPGEKPVKVMLKFRNHAEAEFAAHAIQAAAMPVPVQYPQAA